MAYGNRPTYLWRLSSVGSRERVRVIQPVRGGHRLKIKPIARCNLTLWIDVACLAWILADTGHALLLISYRGTGLSLLKSYLQKRIRQIRRGSEEIS